MDEKRKFLASIVRTAIGQIDQDSPLCHSYETSLILGQDENATQVKKIKACDKLKALELDAKLAGEFIDRVEVKHTHLTLEELEQRQKDADA